MGPSVTETTAAVAPLQPLPKDHKLGSAASLRSATSFDLRLAHAPLFAYLFASPLTQRAGEDDVQETVEELEELDVRREAEDLRMKLHQAQRPIRMRIEVATRESLRQLLQGAAGCRADVLHFTCHGFPDGFLALEDAAGHLDRLGTNDLRGMLAAQQQRLEHEEEDAHEQPGGTRVVFVSACFSQYTGEVFVAAGVPHVVAVRRDSMVADRVGNTFAQNFHEHLLRGATVRAAFDHAQRCVQLTPGKDDAWRVRQRAKFLLLPASGPDLDSETTTSADDAHAVPVFAPDTGSWDSLPEASVRSASHMTLVRDETPAPPPSSCCRPVAKFVGRRFTLQCLAASLAPGAVAARRWVTLHGPDGIGKTACAVAACAFLSRRRHCRAICFVPLAPPPAGADDAHARADLLDQVRTHAPGGTGLGGAESESDLHRRLVALGARAGGCSGAVVLLLDGCDRWACNSAAPEQRWQLLRDFIDGVLRATDRVAVLCTSRAPVSAAPSLAPSAEPLGASAFLAAGPATQELALALGPLTDAHAAKLVVRLCRRPLVETEVLPGPALGLFSKLSSAQQMQQLGAHVVVRACRGHPQVLEQLAERLETAPLNDLLPFAQDAARALADPETGHEPSEPPPSFPAQGQHVPLRVPRDLAAPLLPLSAPEHDASWEAVTADKLRAALMRVSGSEARWAAARSVASDALALILHAPHNALGVRRRWTAADLDRLGAVFRALDSDGNGGDSTDAASAAARLARWLAGTARMLLLQRACWDAGLIYGLVSKEEVNRMLGARPAGTFMLRISESRAGSLALAYRAADGAESGAAVVHALLTPAEQPVGGVHVMYGSGRKTYASLADFVACCDAVSALWPDEPKGEALLRARVA